jgi:hypothetical protein
MAARTLAIEFAKLWAGDEDCALPQRVTSISRQGVSYTLLDSQDFIDDVRTGLYAVDLFLKTSNPDKARARARVFTPDVPRARRYTPKALPLTANVQYDLTVVKNTSAVWASANAASSDVTVFFDEVGWTPEVTLRSAGGTRTVDLPSAQIVTNATSETVTFTVTYDDAYKALGSVDPGTWTLYATRTVDGVETVSELETGNLQIKMYS